MTGESGEIATAIEQLRSQLSAAQESSKDARLRFVVTEAEIEFLLEVTKEGGGSAGIRLGLLKAGADGKVSTGTSHHLKLRLDVIDTYDGKRAVVSDRR